ncbi:ABC transporter permease [Ketogulonicigenium vulgare]|uniref:ABC transporter, permease protein n=1 Tax=Ketogulonicigenium vulgare (strain WSH-001) TaxID=759362 RepID=F9Y953_KETVW|nr:ABC transporter permease [Ketogulonicigenium vulgare]ADO43090.1 ABC-transport protein, inner membrane component [Ketogulonicigenium vulgare Y25]AEM41270.1 ABC transporter, permease protein [Ketogulonicigenium vulgare WSH-001]ALJ81408.1 peptide ABC transporter [Ketogulonicigenium vulgare]ANW34134.1 peptide ABC transporter [Ketogulonicigenium vulgare]AOZ55003.1 ABC transporter inner membrane protein [Ketogulonicigenium vulgare]
MLNLILRRLLVAIPTLILVSILIFCLQKLLPGDPALMFAGEERDPEVLALIRAQHHLDRPVLVQYGYWMAGVLQGDFGHSLRTGIPVTDLIVQKLPVTLQLTATAMMIAMITGISLGILAAARQGKLSDAAINAVGLTGMSIPNFWLGIILIMVVSVQLRWLPSAGFVSITDDPGAFLRSVIMPAFVLSTPITAYLMRHTRSAMIGALRSDYIRTARAKGLRRPVVTLKHAFRNALMPIVTMVTLLFGELMAGAVLTEQIFTIPGFGKLIVDGVFTRDYPVVQGVVLCTAVSFILLNLLADILYILINPKLRHA